ncbi:MAG: PTS sugar transporter subunit IIA [bacterium]
MVQRVALDPRRVLLGVRAPDRQALLLQMANALLTAPGMPHAVGPQALVEALMERADGDNFMVDEGIVVPHARLPGVLGPRICLATLAEPLPWEGDVARVVVLIVGPPSRPGALLQVMGRLARLLIDPANRARVEQATDPVALATWLQSTVREEDAPILAEDIMRPSHGRFHPDLPLPSLTQMMAEMNLDAAGITDADRRLVGQVTADDLFTHGIPDFFRQLKSVSFIAEFDPFEKYFEKDHDLLVKDIMNQQLATCGPHATALEVVFLLSVKRFPKVYVVDAERRLLGVIDRIRVLDRIFNL